MKKRKVRINAAGVSSKYGYIVDEFEDMALIKVGCSTDWVKCLAEPYCIVLGANLYEEI